jgi:hypothetical protein
VLSSPEVKRAIMSEVKRAIMSEVIAELRTFESDGSVLSRAVLGGHKNYELQFVLNKLFRKKLRGAPC